MSKDELFAAAMALDPKEREQLAERLWLSTEHESEADIDEAWAREIEDRVATYERGEVGFKPVDEVIERLLSRRHK